MEGYFSAWDAATSRQSSMGSACHTRAMLDEAGLEEVEIFASGARTSPRWTPSSSQGRR